MSHQPTFSILPEVLPYSDLPQSTSQHITHEGLQVEQPEKILHGRDPQPNNEDKYYEGLQDLQEKKHTARRICGLAPCMLWSAIGATTIAVVGAAFD
jgi:hypothetical protein